MRTLLPEPIVATVVDAAGTPLPGVLVDWSVDGEGEVTATAPRTDAEGRVRAYWVLGGTAGPSQAAASVPDLEPARFTATAESSGGVPPGGTPPEELPFDDIRVLAVPTYDGSGQVVHPDYVRSPAGAFGSPHHLAITPYPQNNALLENPSHFVGTGPDRWSLESGAPNPVIRPTTGYLSDPDLVFVPETGELWLYYRQVIGDNFVHLMRSRDGLRWSAPVEVARAPAHEVVSPSVVRRGPGDWWMWAVNSGSEGCGVPSTTIEVRRSMDGEHWSAPEPVALNQQDLFAWHVEVQWIPSRNEFWALYNVKGSGGCATPALFMATSPDGYTWTVHGAPVLVRGRIPALADIVYRSTLEYDPATDAITFWYSGARHTGKEYVWSAAVERRRRIDVFAPAAALVSGERLLRPAPAELGDEWP